MNINLKNTSNQYNYDALIKLEGVRPFSLEDDKLLFENETQLHILGFLMFFGGITLIFWNPDFLNFFLSLFLCVFFIGLGFIFIRKIGSFSVLNTSDNTLYREYRFGNFVLFKWKLIKLSDVVQIGVTHEIGRPMNYGEGLNGLIFKFVLKVLKGREYIETKPFNPVFGGVEKTATIYLTKDGKIGRINNFSYLYNSDDINEMFAKSLSLYANIPGIKANPYKGLAVKKTANQYSLVTCNLKRLFFTEKFIRFIVTFSLVFLAIGFFVLLIYLGLI